MIDSTWKWNGMISWSGLAACGIGASFCLLSHATGERARQLQDIPQLEHLAELKAIVGIMPLMVSICGRICSDKPLESENSPVKGVLHRSIVKQHFMKQGERGNWERDTQTISDFTREADWYIRDSSGVKVQVHNGKSAEGLQLHLVHDSYESESSNMFKSSMDYLRGLKILGLRKTEYLLPVGESITAIGEIHKQTQKSKSILSTGPDFVLKRPSRSGVFFLTDKSMPELVTNLSAVSRGFMVLGVGFTCIGIFLVTRKAIKYFVTEARLAHYRKRVKEELMKKGLIDSSDEDNEEGNTIAKPTSEGLCVICMEKKYDSIFAKCGHMCCCIDCARKLYKCPICRTHHSRSSIIKVYSA